MAVWINGKIIVRLSKGKMENIVITINYPLLIITINYHYLLS